MPPPPSLAPTVADLRGASAPGAAKVRIALSHEALSTRAQSLVRLAR